jgi:DNA polymerase-3 subunit delta
LGYDFAMKFTTIRAFQKHVEGAEKSGFATLYLIIAPEGGEGKLSQEILVQALMRKEGIAPLGVTACDAKVVLDEVHNGNMFSPKRILVVNGAESIDKDGETLLLKPLPPGLFVILMSREKGGAFFKKVEKEGIVVELGGEKSWEKERSAQDWIAHRFQQEKKSIDPAAIHLLAKESGGEIALLEEEINKLITYAANKTKVSREDVAAVSISRPAVNVFQLSEALFKRDVPTAISLFRTLLDEETSYFAILKQLRSQVKVDLEIASILRAGGNVQEITTAFPYIKGFILEKHLETVRTWGFDGLKRALVYLDDFEIRAKEGSPDYTLLSDLLILKLT